MPYPGTKLQEQCPLSRQLWRNQVENKEGPNNTTKPRAYSSNCSSSNSKPTLPLMLHTYLDQKILKICYSSQAWLQSGTTELEVWVSRSGMNAHTQLDQHAPVVLDGCLTPVKELIFSKVWGSYCGLSLWLEETREARLVLRDSQVSIHTSGITGDFRCRVKGEEETGAYRLPLRIIDQKSSEAINCELRKGLLVDQGLKTKTSEY